jgi:hypothetical protein
MAKPNTKYINRIIIEMITTCDSRSSADPHFFVATAQVQWTLAVVVGAPFYAHYKK